MALVSIGTIGSVQNKTAGTTTVITPTNQLDAGNIGIVVVAIDNVQTTDGISFDVTGVTDSSGNVWNKDLREFTNGQGGAGLGATIAVFWSKIVTSVPTTGSITATHTSVTARAMSCWEFSIAAGNSLQEDGRTNLAEDGVNDPGTVTIGGLSLLERIWIRCGAIEGPETANYTPTSGWTAITNNQTAGGGGGSNMGVRAEFIIALATSATSDPTLVLNGRDCANMIVAFSEIATPTDVTTQPQWIQDDL